ncbi:MAG: glutaminyl-peptide cyclotransferase [Aureliella sp.]
MPRKSLWIALSVIGIPVVAVIVAAVLSANERPQAGLPIAKVEVVASFNHDPDAFTQGLAVEGETLYEGTGKRGRSSLRRVDLKTGRILQKVPLNSNYFGEGITILDDKIYQLTWQGKQCGVYNKADFKYLETLPYRWTRASEGWGIATDGKVLFVSDGSNNIFVVDPKTLKEIRRFRVKDGRRRLEKLNELEYVRGELLANIWYEDLIARIDPVKGELIGWIDCTNVYPARSRPDQEHVLNGIAYDAKADRLFVTGKNWPKLYEIKIIE